MLGLGAGWNKREHNQFGFDLLDPKSRFDRFEEGMQVVTRLLQSDEPVTFDGQYYQLRGATLLPRPERPGGPRILIGGNGVKRTLSYVVRYADEWNCVMLLPDKLAHLNERLSQMLNEAGRDPQSVRRSMMTGCVFGKDEAALNRKIRMYGKTLQEIRQSGVVAGSISDIQEQLQALEQAGLQRIMLQWLDLDDLESLEELAKGVL
jgi:alkanesulfonate monooxygenase SsuD/methylene tetrahydromethanopterin reductase-like flavin-dependent oxidoreductase (luciferase family)